jgi:hypothetical protein
LWPERSEMKLGKHQIMRFLLRESSSIAALVGSRDDPSSYVSD